MMASSGPLASALDQASTLRLASLVRLVLAAEVMVSAPQQARRSATTTSTPCRVSRRMVASLIAGAAPAARSRAAGPRACRRSWPGGPRTRASARGRKPRRRELDAAAPVFMPSAESSLRTDAPSQPSQQARGGSAPGWAASCARQRSARSSAAGERFCSMWMRAMVDEVHVVDAARAGGHAGEAGEAAVDVMADLGGADRAAARACP